MEFCIGVELEGLWKGKPGFHLPVNDKEHKQFAEALVPVYNKIRDEDMLRAIFIAGSHPGRLPNDKSQWNVTIDGAIGEAADMMGESLFKGHPLEFVSPKMRFGRSGEWRKNVEKHWDTVSQILTLEIDEMCATHVHISPAIGEQWTLEQLKQLAKAIIYFNDALKAIYAPSRRNHDLTHSNKKDNYKLKSRDVAESCELIDKCASKLDLLNLMQSPLFNIQTRDYAWNFENTVKKPGSKEKETGSVEFRCAPATTNAKHCFIWVELAVSFVQATQKPDTNQVLKDKVYKDDAEGLKGFILRAGVDGMNNKDLLAIVFQEQNGGKGWKTDDEMRAAFDKSLIAMVSTD